MRRLNAGGGAYVQLVSSPQGPEAVPLLSLNWVIDPPRGPAPMLDG